MRLDGQLRSRSAERRLASRRRDKLVRGDDCIAVGEGSLGLLRAEFGPGLLLEWSEEVSFSGGQENADLGTEPLGCSEQTEGEECVGFLGGKASGQFKGSGRCVPAVQSV